MDGTDRGRWINTIHFSSVKAATVSHSHAPVMQSAWNETPIFEAVRNYNPQANAVIETIMSNQAIINAKCKTLSLGVFRERSALHLAIDEFLDPEVINGLIRYGADSRCTMSEVKDGSVLSFNCFQRLEHIRAACNHPSSGDNERASHLEWCGRTFTQEW